MARRTPRVSKAMTNSAGRLGSEVTGRVTGALEGVEDIAKEVGLTATAAVRGSMRAAEQIGGDLLSTARGAVEGSLDAAERIAAATDRAIRRVLTGNQRVTTRSSKEAPVRAKGRSGASRRRKSTARESRSAESS